MTLQMHSGSVLDSPLSLVHCISGDAVMGRGLAPILCTAFPQLRTDATMQPPLLISSVSVVDVTPDASAAAAAAAAERRYIFSLVTKRFCYGKPTHGTLEAALRNLCEECIARGVQQLAMPRIGCGLDQMKWDDVRNLLERVFSPTHIVLHVYTPVE